MSKFLRITVPVAQVLLMGATVACSDLCHDPRMIVNYFGPARDLLLKENFPLVVTFSPFLYGVDWADGLFGPVGEAGRLIGTVLLGFALLLGVTLFWYFAVIEAETRRQGGSLLRFRNSAGECVALIGLFLIGAGSLLYAYKDGTLLLRLGRSKIEVFLGGLFLVIWGTVLIGMFGLAPKNGTNG